MHRASGWPDCLISEHRSLFAVLSRLVVSAQGRHEDHCFGARWSGGNGPLRIRVSDSLSRSEISLESTNSRREGAVAVRFRDAVGEG